MIKNKKILIFGRGKEGQAAAKFLQAENEITIYDDKEANLDPKENFDLIIRSPGVRPDHPLIKKLTASGAVVTSATKIFFDLCPCPIIGITGTKGKGTTSTLIYQLLKTQNPKTFLAGNIGLPALEILPKLDKNSLAVLELSSFQLMDLTKSPHVSVVLMITQEHLDWHLDEEEYLSAKISITKFQSAQDYAVINTDFPNSKKLASATKGKVFYFSTQNKTNGAYIKNGQLQVSVNGEEIVASTKDVLLPGAHNLQNVLAAITVAKIYKISNENIKKVLKNFKGLKHRLQLIKEFSGVKYYNDSFSTTPETTIAAIRSFPENPKILILGGSSKNSNFDSLAKEIVSQKTVKSLILIGIETKRIQSAIAAAGGFKGTIIEGAKNMEEIIRSTQKLSTSGDIVLLSPACASFDMFNSYEDRGDQFIQGVNKL